MRVRTVALASIMTLAQYAAAPAQQYATPAPRTTSIPTLHELARDRQVTERFHLGIGFEQKGDYAAAIPEFQAILALRPPEPKYSTAQYDLGIAFANTRRLREAAAAFDAAIAADPGFLAAMANLVAVNLLAGDTAGARAAAERFVKAAPDSARALYSRGIVALQQNDLSVAREDFSRLLSSNQRYAIAYYDLGVVESRAGNWFAAQREFSLALDIAPQYARARFALGTVLLRQGRRAEARDAFGRVAQDSNGDTALQNLAQELRDAIHAKQ